MFSLLPSQRSSRALDCPAAGLVRVVPWVIFFLKRRMTKIYKTLFILCDLKVATEVQAEGRDLHSDRSRCLLAGLCARVFLFVLRIVFPISFQNPGKVLSPFSFQPNLDSIVTRFKSRSWLTDLCACWSPNKPLDFWLFVRGSFCAMVLLRGNRHTRAEGDNHVNNAVTSSQSS